MKKIEEILSKEELDLFKKERDHLKKTGIPRCLNCKKDFVNDIDSITGKISKNLWKPQCKCTKLRLALG